MLFTYFEIKGVEMIPKKWLHISETGSDPWVLPIWASIHKAIKEGRIKEPMHG